MKRSQLSAFSGQQQCKRVGIAPCLEWTQVFALLVIVLLTLSCHKEPLRAQPAQSMLPAPVAPPILAPPSDPWAAYRPVLAGDSLEKQREIFQLGYRFFQEKNSEGARLFFARTLEVYPPLADYSLYYLGTLSREEGQTEEAKTFFLRLLTNHPDSVWVDRTALALATFALAENNWEAALHYAERARTARMAPAAVRHKAALIVAQAREGQGNIPEAYRLYQEVRRTTPGSGTGKMAKTHVERLRTLAPERFGLRNDREYLEEIRLLTKEADTSRVTELTQQFTAQFPNSALQPDVQTLLAAVYKGQGRVEDAIAAWKEIVTRYPDSAVAPTALHSWASLLWNKDRDSEARVVFERLTQRYPQHRQAAEAWYAIGRIFQEKKDDDRAAAAYQRLAILFPDNAHAREGRWRQAWMAYRRGDFRQAEELFTSLARSTAGTPEGESALYWQARSAAQRGQTEKAAQGYQDLLRRYPDGYYALWAEKWLQKTPPPLNPGTDGTVPSPSLSPALDAHYRKSQELVAIGLLSLARRELDVVKEQAQRDPAFTRFLLAEYSRVQGHAVALRMAVSLLRESKGNWQRYLYPHAYWEIVSIHAEEKRLDPYLVLALIRQESLFDPEAVSPAQAYGLMQLLPSTAARVVQTSAVSPAKLTDPTFNIATGTAYLRQLLDQFDENLIMAVAAYNAGENAVDKWKVRYPDLEPDEFVESISYRETRNYVKLVLRNYRTYQRLYAKELGTGGQGLVSIEREGGRRETSPFNP